ncbi:hypothetical protein [Methanoculleus chikugoensis]|uniref:hypothetical protein n=1 Tax=Methanoculleus chikugoensis TaxID=118126 RepID=UPI001C7E2F06|nr:hypothetical protein [Methanoculleus chikugoensis]
MSIMLYSMIRGRNVPEFSDVHRGSQLTTSGGCSNWKIEDPLYSRDLEIFVYLSGEFYNVTLLELSNHIESRSVVDPSMAGEILTVRVPDIPKMGGSSHYAPFPTRTISTESCDESGSLTPEWLQFDFHSFLCLERSLEPPNLMFGFSTPEPKT